MDEFEQQILSYKEIEEKVKLEDEKMNVGSICLLTGLYSNCKIGNFLERWVKIPLGILGVTARLINIGREIHFLG